MPYPKSDAQERAVEEAVDRIVKIGANNELARSMIMGVAHECFVAGHAAGLREAEGVGRQALDLARRLDVVLDGEFGDVPYKVSDEILELERTLAALGEK